MGIAAFAAVLIAGFPIELIVSQLIKGTNDFTLTAVPMFVLAGYLMDIGGIGERLVNLARSIIGGVRGGLGMAAVGAEMFFAGVSGSITAEMSALTSVVLPGMNKAGYKSEYSLSIMSAATAMGILIPPSIPAVVFGAATNVSVSALFVAGILPALFLSACIIIFLIYHAKVMNLPVDQEGYSWKRLVISIKSSLIPLGMPVIIFGGIFLGYTTPTEAAAISVLYAFVVGAFVYRKLTWDHFFIICRRSAITSGVIFLLLGLSSSFSYLLAVEHLPEIVAETVKAISPTAWFVVFSACILIIFLSMLIEVLPAGIIVIPIFLPIVDQLDVDRLYFVTMAIAAGGIGMFLPPAGVGLMIGAAVGNVEVTKIFRPVLPFIAILIIGLIVLISIPSITLILPRLFGL